MDDTVDLSGIGGRVYGYGFVTAANDVSFKGSVQRLPRADADKMRAQIARSVPDRILEVFWTEDECEVMQAVDAAQQRYIDLANALIDEN